MDQTLSYNNNCCSMVQEFIERKIQLFFKQNEACQHLAEILGIGVLSATELVATVDDANQFQSGRHLVAYLGLVPRQWSSGGKTNLCGISKRGDAYLRKLLIYGARSLCVTKVLQSAQCPFKLKGLLMDQHKPKKAAVVAMTNKNVRGGGCPGAVVIRRSVQARLCIGAQKAGACWSMMMVVESKKRITKRTDELIS